MTGVEAAGEAAWPASAQAAKGCFWAACASSHPRFENLLDVLRYKLDAAPDEQPFRGIVFTEQRVMTHILQHIIASSDLSCRMRSACLYAAGSPATPSLGISKSEASSRTRDFAAGRTNCWAHRDRGECDDIPADIISS
ncbi:hypothetical protein T492DRAFT_178115 [Pavlovales sp. CCMP2436]|nr:hypothetical protein T492DRAFT_178115 [Pavlovales sp. CCMP2436]